jgi:hypothetical protein
MNTRSQNTKTDSSNRLHGGSVTRENFSQPSVQDDSSVRLQKHENFHKTSEKKQKIGQWNSASACINPRALNLKPVEKCLAGRDTDLMFTKQGVPIQTKLFKDLSQTDQMAVIHGEAISLSQKEMEAVCTLAHLKHKSNTPNMDLIPVPEGMWPKTGHQSRYLRDTLHQPFRQVGIGTLPRTFLPKSRTLIRDPIPIVIKEGILFPANKKCWLDSLLTIPTTYCRDPGIQIYLQPTRTWAERYTKGEASLTITKARLHQSPLHLQER